MSGGGQERGLRSGTLPTHLVVGLGMACQVAKEVGRGGLWEPEIKPASPTLPAHRGGGKGAANAGPVGCGPWSVRSCPSPPP